MGTITTTLESGDSAFVGAISSSSEYTIEVNSGVQGANIGNFVFTNSAFSNTTLTLALSNSAMVLTPGGGYYTRLEANGSITLPGSIKFTDNTVQNTAWTGVAAPYAWTNTQSFSNSVTFSGSAVIPSSNTLGTALGSSTQRWVLIANTGTFSGAVSGITTLAAGNTTITGFANVTSTIQGGSTLIIAGAASGITTLAAGNTTITGFANVSSTLQVTGDTTLSANLTVSGNVSGNTAGFAIGYRDVPQNFTNTSFTLALTDAGKHILTQNSGSSTQTVTIPPNGTVAFQTGAAITIVVQSTGTVAVANGAGVTMYLAGNSTAKSTVTLNSYSMTTLLKIGTDTWMVSGTGVT